ncbi:MAG: diguanylate cyclase [Candidatus Acidiferrales bacterium]|jgi:two-component system cell cycle response regulator
MKVGNTEKMRILIAEDDKISRRVLEASLAEWGYDVTSVADGKDALGLLRGENAPRLAVLDWMMPGLEGVEVCAKIRERVDQPYVYVLLLSARNEKQDMLAGLKAGADDYLTKPFDTQELRARLFAGERIITLQDELIAARDALQFQATHDALTGLLNRGAILRDVTRELTRARREHASLGVILVDVDHFKAVNDDYGHLTGDAVLHGVALRMSGLLRAYDSIGRYGGEEFLVLAPSSDAEGAMQFAERLRAGVESTTYETEAGSLRLTLSLGVAISNPEEAPNTQALLQAADAALYRAKARGRNRVAVATAADFIIETTASSAMQSSRHA